MIEQETPEPLPLVDVYSPVAELLHRTLSDKLKDPEVKARVVSVLMDWLRNRAKKKSVPDLPARLATWENRVRKMVQNMSFDFSQAKPVIKVSGSDEATLKAFQFGSNWFEPNAELEETILTGLFEK